MRKVVASEFVSLDGVMESPEKWQFPNFNDEMGEALGTQMFASDALLMGRATYEEFAGAWTSRSGDPFSDYINYVSKFVVSTTLHHAGWNNSTLIKENIAEEIIKLKQQPGKNITLTGSATLVQSLMQDDLIDEYQLLVCPVVVGSGKRIFEDEGEQKALKLVDSTIFSTGVVYVTYQPAAE